VTTKLDYMLTGCANGHPLRIQGTGSVTDKRLRFAVWPVEVPLDFDPAFALVTAVDLLLAVAGGLVKAPRDGLVGRTRVDVLGEGSVAVGTLLVLAAVERHKGRYSCRAQLTEARLAMEVGERLVGAEERVLNVLPLFGGCGLASAVSVSSSRGRELILMTITRVEGGDVVHDRLMLPAFQVGRSRHLARMNLPLQEVGKGEPL
jgi:hypothetical protein